MPRLSHLALAVLMSAACRAPAPEAAPTPEGAAQRLGADVAWLADDAREGRGTGTAGNDSAAVWIARRFGTLRLSAFPRPDVSGCRGGVGGRPDCFVQPFVARPPVRGGAPRQLPTQNVVAFVPGRDAAARDEYVVVGAHFDHLGRSTEGARDADAKDAIRNGADDNASGTATVLELARRLSRAPTRRSVVFVTFSGEELGLLGSAWFADHSPVPMTRVTAMLNFDMVGRLRDDKLLVYGTATAAELPAILGAANTAPALKLNAVGDGMGPSDHQSFYLKDLPVLHFFTDLHDQYHTAADDFPLIDAAGMARVTDFAERVLRDIGDRPARLTFTKAPTTQQRAASRTGSGVYLGSVPDMGASDVKGMRLSGVRAGSPADSAGMKSGDIIVQFGDKVVDDIYGYTDALNAYKPGDVVEVVVLRGGVRVPLKVTLGKRG